MVITKCAALVAVARVAEARRPRAYDVRTAQCDKRSVPGPARERTPLNETAELVLARP